MHNSDTDVEWRDADRDGRTKGGGELVDDIEDVEGEHNARGHLRTCTSNVCMRQLSDLCIGHA